MRNDVPCNRICQAGSGHVAIQVAGIRNTCEDSQGRQGGDGPALHGGATWIAFVEDPDGYKIEFIER